MELEHLRKRIDGVDRKLVKLIGERLRIAEAIAREKRVEGKQIEDVAREKKVLEHIRSIAQEENISQEDVEIIYKQIITASKDSFSSICR